MKSQVRGVGEGRLVPLSTNWLGKSLDKMKTLAASCMETYGSYEETEPNTGNGQHQGPTEAMVLMSEQQ